MTRVEVVKAIRAFLEANKLNTKAINNEDGLTHYFFVVNQESIQKQLEIILSVGDEGDFSSILYLDLENKVNEEDVYKLVNWLNLENSGFVGTITYVPEDNAISLIKSVDAYFHKEIYGEEISYLVKIQIDFIEEYFDAVEAIVSGKSFEEAVSIYYENQETH